MGSMRRPQLTLALALPVLLLAACGGGGGKKTVEPPLPIDEALALAPHVVRVDEAQTGQGGYRLFLIQFEQPVDHANPAGPTFEQFAALLWKDYDLPVVLGTNGYGASRNPGRAEVTALLGANQLTVEHRFFDPSSPTPKDWSKLDIEQAANDLHRIVASLRPVLGQGKWISTGASKGGMTAVYHRRFWPDDVDGTVAYVAPQSFSTSDPAYVAFVDGVGGTSQAACREKLRTFQRALLSRRAEVQPLFEQAAAAESDGFTLLGADQAYTFSVVELPFAFWQYGAPSNCSAIPASDAAATTLFSFMDAVLGVVGWVGDASLLRFAPYYHQSATQLGGPAYGQDHLLDLLPGGVPANDVPEVYPPLGVAKPWDGAAMPDVDAWVKAEGERLMFVYGGYDPWSTTTFVPNAAKDSVRYVVAGANHGASLTRLLQADPAAGAAAQSTVRRWAGVAAGALTAAEPVDFDPRVLLYGERGAPKVENPLDRGFEQPLRLDGSGSAR